MKKGILSIAIVLILSLSFISASYSNFSIGELLDRVDSSTMLLGCLFLIFFAVINFALSKVFKDKCGNPNTAVTAIVGLCVSILIIYGINKTGFDIEELLYGMGLSDGMLGTLIPIILIIGAIYTIWRIKPRGFLILFGSIFLLITLATNWIYEEGILTALGIVMILIGLYLVRRKRRRESRGYGYGNPGMFKRFKDWRDPRNRLERIRNKQELKQARRQIWEERGSRWGTRLGKGVGWIKGKSEQRREEQEKRRALDQTRRKELAQQMNIKYNQAIKNLYEKNRGPDGRIQPFSNEDKKLLKYYQDQLTRARSLL